MNRTSVLLCLGMFLGCGCPSTGLIVVSSFGDGGSPDARAGDATAEADGSRDDRGGPSDTGAGDTATGADSSPGDTGGSPDVVVSDRTAGPDGSLDDLHTLPDMHDDDRGQAMDAGDDAGCSRDAGPCLLPPPDKMVIGAGGYHTCHVTRSGEVKCWGDNAEGQIGIGGGGENIRMPTSVTGLGSGAVSVATGNWHSCALLATGAVKCWGQNTVGQLGNGETGDPQFVPVDVTGLGGGAVALSTNYSNSCVLLDSGDIQCWGANYSGQLGNGESGDPIPSPVTVSGLGAAAIDMGVGSMHACALLNGGAVKCWGNDDYGQLGNDEASVGSSTPVDVVGLSSGVVDIVVGEYDNCAILTGGSMKCWGVNAEGEIGDGNDGNRPHTPVDVIGLGGPVVTAAIGYYHTCAILADGTVKCWGWDKYGQLGNGRPAENELFPALVSSVAPGAIQISAGKYHTCILLETGEIQCWGWDRDGQLGDGGYTTNRDLPTTVLDMSPGVDVIGAGCFHTCAGLGDGSMKCWGMGESGQLGYGGNEVYLPLPTDVTGLDGAVVSIAAGLYHTCAANQAGAVKCWGRAQEGQLGHDAEAPLGQRTPQDVIGLSSGVVALAAGDYHSCALLDTTGVKCWGNDVSGQAGNDPVLENIFSPQDVQGLTTGVVALSANRYNSCAVTAAGDGKCWGDDAYGQLGNGAADQDMGTPVDVVGLAAAATDVAVGSRHACALLVSGAVQCWGDDAYGQLGNAQLVGQQNSPTDVTGLTDVVTALAAGEYHTCALYQSGQMACWGGDMSEQLGDGPGATDTATPVGVATAAGSAIAVAAGDWHSCSLQDAGAMLCWGSDATGQLGDDELFGIGSHTATYVVGIPE